MRQMAHAPNGTPAKWYTRQMVQAPNGTHPVSISLRCYHLHFMNPDIRTLFLLKCVKVALSVLVIWMLSIW
jgi:hypothetical protein